MPTHSILVVDDEPEIREILSVILAKSGHTVSCAGDGVEAGRVLAQAKFDLVITDLLMPERDGLEVIAEVRKKYPGVRIIAMSGGGHVPGEQYLGIARGFGAHVVLPKPFNICDVESAVVNAMAGAAPK